MFFYNRKRVINQIGACNWNWKNLSKTCQIHCIYAIYDCKCSSKKYRIYWGMNDRSYFCKIKKHWILKKKFSLQLYTVTYKEKYFSRTNYFRLHPFLKNFCIVIAGVSYFRVYKLIESDPGNICLFKVNSKNTRKRYEIRPKFTINAIENCSGVFTVKCFHCWLWIGKCLPISSFLRKYYYSKSKVEKMLYWTLFKVAAYFLNR